MELLTTLQAYSIWESEHGFCCDNDVYYLDNHVNIRDKYSNIVGLGDM